VSILVDSNILIDIWSDNATWGERSRIAVTAMRRSGQLVINGLIYAEVSVGFASRHRLDEELGDLGIPLVEIPREALFRAGKAFRDYRRRAGTRDSILPDFVIGAHAEVEALPVLTRDPRRYRTYFPAVRLIEP